MFVLHYSFIQYQNRARLIHHLSSYNSTNSQYMGIGTIRKLNVEDT